MANDKHVALLKQGVDAWNAWRSKNPKIRPDLTGLRIANAHFPMRILAGRTSSKLTSVELTSARQTSVGLS